MLLHYYKIISFLFVLGIFLMPVSSYACATKVKKVHSTEKTDIKSTATFSNIDNSCESGTCEEKCCHEDSKNCAHNSCNGNCSSTSCTTGGFTFLGNLPFYGVKNNLLFSLLKKDSFHYLNSDYSFGFQSIWQPPKIG